MLKMPIITQFSRETIFHLKTTIFLFQMLQMGVTPHSTYTTPNLEYMTQAKRRAHLGERAFVALFIAAHRGHQKLVERLIAEGIVNIP